MPYLIKGHLQDRIESKRNGDHIAVTSHSAPDESVIFSSGFIAAFIADSFIGFSKNLPPCVQLYNREYRSVIIGESSMSDLRIRMGIDPTNLQKSLELERNIAESMQFGALLASSFITIFFTLKPFERFSETAYSKGLFHHELYAREYGKKTNIIKEEEQAIQKPRRSSFNTPMRVCNDRDYTNNGGSSENSDNAKEEEEDHQGEEDDSEVEKEKLWSKKDSGDVDELPKPISKLNTWLPKTEILNDADKVVDKSSSNTNTSLPNKENSQNNNNNNNNKKEEDIYPINGYGCNYSFDPQKLSIRIYEFENDNTKHLSSSYYTTPNKGKWINNKIKRNNTISKNVSPKRSHIFTDRVHMRIESMYWNWKHFKIICSAYGINNSTVTGNMPTSNSSIKIGGTPSFQFPKGIYVQLVGKNGTSINICWSGILYLSLCGCWNDKTRQIIATNYGSVAECIELDDFQKRVLTTVFEIDPQIVLLHDIVRQPFVCQSQSSNRDYPYILGNEDYVCELWNHASEAGLIALEYYASVSTPLSGMNNSSLADKKRGIEMLKNRNNKLKQETSENISISNATSTSSSLSNSTSNTNGNGNINTNRVSLIKLNLKKSSNSNATINDDEQLKEETSKMIQNIKNETENYIKSDNNILFNNKESIGYEKISFGEELPVCIGCGS